MRKKKSAKTFLWTVFLPAAILLLATTPFFSGVRAAAGDLSLPFLRPFHDFGRKLADWRQTLASLGTLNDQLRRAREENLALRARLARLKFLEGENGILREKLRLPLPTEKKRDFVGADIAAFDPGVDYRSILIDRGREDGVKPGQVAVLPGDILLGVVAEAGRKSARVKLLSDPSMLVKAAGRSSGDIGIVGGDSGLGLKLQMSDPTLALAEGEEVYTAAGSVFPPDLWIGTLRDIRSSDDGLFREATVETPYDLRREKFVLIILDR